MAANVKDNNHGGLTVALFAVALGAVRVVAHADEAMTSISGINEAIRARPLDGLIVGRGAAVQLVEDVAVLLVGQGALLGAAVGLVVAVNCRGGLLVWSREAVRPAGLAAAEAGAPAAAPGVAPVIAVRRDGGLVAAAVVVLKVGPFLCLLLLRRQRQGLPLAKNGYRSGQTKKEMSCMYDRKWEVVSAVRLIS